MSTRSQTATLLTVFLAGLWAPGAVALQSSASDSTEALPAEPAQTELVQAAPVPAAAVPSQPEKGKSTKLILAPKQRQFPPRLFGSPTGRILPSLGLYAASGWTMGLTDNQGKQRWVVAFGLGGVGEVTIASARLTHITDPSSDALAGFRIRTPLGWLSKGLDEKVFLAFNLAATDESEFRTGQFESADGFSVQSLSYSYRETTVGVSVTLNLGRTDLTGVAHVTDMRAADIAYVIDGDRGVWEAQKESYPSFGLGLEYAANLTTHVILEARTIPQVMFLGETGELWVDNGAEATGGIRFFPFTPLGLDATVSIDDDALGIADMKIGFGLHLVLSPTIQRGS